MRPDINAVTGGDEKVGEVLWDALVEVWKLIDEELIKGLIACRGRRFKHA